MANDGRAFEGEIARSALKQGLLYQKLVVPIRFGPGGRSVKLAENPHDAYLFHQGVFHALELKSQDEHGTFSLAEVAPHQVDGLKDVLARGGRAWLLVNMRCRHEVRVTHKRTGETREIRVSDLRTWALDFSQWDALKASLRYKNGKLRASIPRPLFDDPTWFTPLRRYKLDGEYVWDLSPLLENRWTNETASSLPCPQPTAV